ncbi:MAG: hypothetical protein JWN07_3225 [Hyphomicrobiales bacterium]|nr:hypothetical protein [Hyphomicrobiales bacterium]
MDPHAQRHALDTTARLRDGLRLYCLGDIHGRADLLKRARDGIAADLSHRPVADSLIICLGDYIDRGPDSAGVLDLLAGPSFPARTLLLRGNHEVMLQSFLREPQELGAWRHFGGLETLASYGVDISEASLGHGFEAAWQSLQTRMPAHHQALLEDLHVSVAVDDYFFCHAGVRPGAPLEAQSERDLLWIRNEFLSWRGPFGKIVVHGHTPVETPEILPNRINIDTGAYASGRLTCLVLEGASASFLNV